MKTCTRCTLSKNITEYHKRSKSFDGLASMCKSCRRIVDALSYLNSDDRRNVIKANNKRLKAHNYAIIYRFKRRYGCLLCGEKTPVALDLHHLNAKEKDKDLSKMVGYSTSKVRVELRKCVILCSNCHRKVHAGLLVIP